MKFLNFDIRESVQGRTKHCLTKSYTGHTYAGGAFLALVHDYKIMRTEKGWYCFSEVHIKRAFTAGFVELLKYVNSMWYYGMYIVINPRYQDIHISMYSLLCIYQYPSYLKLYTWKSFRISIPIEESIVKN